ncbi:Innexin family-containing protein [Strongyloides ratti]|uniref:Innexin n=1 Tax=Strongyloides ratti TaxID=34506 RepID=A0A090LFG2_STRRB|nr:Innexin family-containing protein [Strongyloides ratti]CEF66888.1 Innexin family-containing protein [Strongyloides ratti]
MLSIPFLEDIVKGWIKKKSFDDPVDRLNHFVTASILGFFAIMVSAKQYLGQPIQCMVPKEFSSGWEHYAEDYCFIQNTFYVPFNETIPKEYDDRRKAEIGYYQWVPIILALQAILFFIPNWIWKSLYSQSGIDLNTIITDGMSLRGTGPNDREENSIKLKEYISDCLGMKDIKRNFRIGFFKLEKNYGNYITALYLFIKLLYVLNIICQFILLNNFLGDYYTMWGLKAIKYKLDGKEWQTSSVFPRVTLCDFDVRDLADVHRFTVQCVLMINMFNEKVYLFIWFWFIFVGIVTILNFIYCCSHFISLSHRHSAVKYLLKHLMNTKNPREFDKAVKHFTSQGLKPDGYLILRFLEGNAGAIIAKDITHKLFQDYLITYMDDCIKDCLDPVFS